MVIWNRCRFARCSAMTIITSSLDRWVLDIFLGSGRSKQMSGGSRSVLCIDSYTGCCNTFKLQRSLGGESCAGQTGCADLDYVICTWLEQDPLPDGRMPEVEEFSPVVAAVMHDGDVFLLILHGGHDASVAFHASRKTVFLLDSLYGSVSVGGC